MQYEDGEVEDLNAEEVVAATAQSNLQVQPRFADTRQLCVSVLVVPVWR